MSILSKAAAGAAIALISSHASAQAALAASGQSAPGTQPQNPAQPNSPLSNPPGANPQENAGAAPTPAPASAQRSNAPEGPETLPVVYQLRRFTLGISVGLSPYGTGTNRSSCEGAACGTTTSGELKYSHGAEEVIQLQGFYQPFALLRFGPVVALNTATKAKFTDANPKTSLTLGNFFTFDLAVEATPRVGNRVWLLPRVQSGLSLLPPSDALKNRLSSYQVACNNGGFRGCDSLDATKLGFNLGLGFGVLLAVNDSYKFRFDALGEYYSLRLFRLEAGSTNASYGETVSGARLGILIGMEL